MKEYYFKSIVCGTTLQGGPMERFLAPMRSETVKALWDAILRNSQDSAKRIQPAVVVEKYDHFCF